MTVSKRLWFWVYVRDLSKRKGNKCGRIDNSYYDRERRVRRWSEEVIITCYQMTGLVEASCFELASALMFEDSRRWFYCGVRELKVGKEICFCTLSRGFEVRGKWRTGWWVLSA